MRERIATAGGVAISVPTDLRRDEELTALLARTEHDLGLVDILETVRDAGRPRQVRSRVKGKIQKRSRPGRRERAAKKRGR